MAQPCRPDGREDFKIAIICALPAEFNAVEAVFDNFWEDEESYGRASVDHNAYTIGRIGYHDVVLVSMPGIGKVHSASVAENLRASFPFIELGLVVGVCAGVPTGVDGEEILLGDVVISTGIVQYDFGRQFANEFVVKDTLHDSSGHSTAEIKAFLSRLSSFRNRTLLRNNALHNLRDLLAKADFEASAHPGPTEDKLFKAEYIHKHRDHTVCSICVECENNEERVCALSRETVCAALGCSIDMLISRRRLDVATERPNERCEERLDRTPDFMIHYGLFASGNTVMKSGVHRDKIARKEKVIAFEMEGAGVQRLPSIIVKGVCDYADSHKNKRWQPYAAATAAACLKALLKEWRPTDKRLKTTLEKQLTLYSSSSGTFHQSIVPREMWPVTSSHSEPWTEVVSRVSDYDYHKSHRRLISKHLSGTSEWFLEHPTLQHWLQKSGTSSLWCYGSVGSGKTMICARLIEFLKKRATKSGEPVVYFFCDPNDRRTTNGKFLLESLMKQLLDSLIASGKDCSVGVKKQIRRYYAPNGPEPDLEDLLDVFALLFTEVSIAWYIVDGLDELQPEDVRKILPWIRNVFEKGSSQKIIIASKDEIGPNIKMSLDLKIRLQQDDMDGDIRRYIDSEISRKMRYERELTDRVDVIDDIRTKLSAKAQGMFLWVRLQIEALWLCKSDKDILSALTDLPPDLATTYERCVKRIPPASYLTAAKTVRWVICANRPLHIDELREAVEFDLGDTEWDPEKCPSRSTIKEACGNLIVLDESDETVRMTHPSAKQYCELIKPFDSLSPGELISDSSTWGKTSGVAGHMTISVPYVSLSYGKSYSVEKGYSAEQYKSQHDSGHYVNVGSLKCGEECINYLSFSNFGLQVQKYSTRTLSAQVPTPNHAVTALPWSRFTSRVIGTFIPTNASRQIQIHTKTPTPYSQDTSNDSRYKLLDYARNNWVSHTRTISQSSLMWNKFRELALSPPSSWNVHPWTPSGQSRSSQLHALLAYATREGHLPLLSLVLEKSQHSQMKDLWNIPFVQDGLPALHAASRLGFEDVVSILLKVCDVNGLDNTSRTALHYAAEKDHLAVAEILLSRKAAWVTHMSEQSETPLTLAARCGSERIVTFLLKKGSLVLPSAPVPNNPIITAAKANHLNIIMLFLQYSDIPKNVASMAFEEAANMGNDEVLKFFLASDQSNRHLIDAYRRILNLYNNGTGYRLTVELILEYHTINAIKDLDLLDLLQEVLLFAAGNGHDRVVDLISAKFRFGSTLEKERRMKELIAATRSLLIASQKGFANVVRQLLKQDSVNINETDSDGLTPLSLAAERGHTEVVALLLEQESIHVNVKTVHGETPLLIALTWSHTKVVRQLLEHKDIQVNMKNNLGNAPLSRAAVNGNLEGVRILLDRKDIEVNLQNSFGDTALSLAARKGYTQIVKLLLEQKGIEKPSTNDSEQPPLLRAGAISSTDIAKLPSEADKF